MATPETIKNIDKYTPEQASLLMEFMITYRQLMTCPNELIIEEHNNLVAKCIDNGLVKEICEIRNDFRGQLHG